MGIEDRSDYSKWLGRRGFPRTTAGNHISARVQEVILSEASAIDARVALVEAACVAITLCRGRAGAVRVPEVFPPVPRRTRQTEITAESWAQLDLVDLSEVFLERIPMVKSCPSFAIALRERHRAKLEGDMVGAYRAWKLFGLVPILLLSRPAHTGSVGRDVLAKRVDEFFPGCMGRAPLQVRENTHDSQVSGGASSGPSGERASVKSKACIYRSSIGTQECDHVGRNAEEETCGAGEPHSTISFGFRARVNVPIGLAVREVPHSAFWVCPRRMHKRDAPLLPRRFRDPPTVHVCS